MQETKLTDKQINQLAKDIAGTVGWKVAWMLFKYPLIFIAGCYIGYFAAQLEIYYAK